MGNACYGHDNFGKAEDRMEVQKTYKDSGNEMFYTKKMNEDVKTKVDE